MNGKKRNLRTDTEAVSPVIGAVLLMAIAVTMLTLFQATMVPYWNKQVEAAEIKVTYDDMMFLPSDIEDVAIHETPKTCTVQLGARYPDRMIFRNPGPGAFGTLAVEEAPVPIIVTYDNGTNSTAPYNSKRITYELAGTINSPKLVYEHGVIIKDWGTVSLTTDEQKLIANDNIYIPILNGSSSSQSAIGVESIAIKPYEYLDTLGDIDTVSVTLYTDYRELWEDTLLSPSVVENLSFSGTVEFGSDEIYINTSVPYLKLPNQTASGPLYAGMISCTVEDPDGGGGGGGGGSSYMGYYNGTGNNIMSSGTQWWDLPSSNDITEITLHTIIVDEDLVADLKDDFIVITINDDVGHWWKATIDFSYNLPNKQISGLVVKNGNGGPSVFQYGGDDIGPQNCMPFDSSTIIDLLSTSNYDDPDGCYQNAGVGSSNILVTYLHESQNPKKMALICYRLTLE